MRNFIKLALVVVLFAACSKLVKKDDLAVVGQDGEKVAYKVELAVTKSEMEKGLMNRQSLDANSGMLFDLRAVKSRVSMWMKDTQIALDMLFIDQDGSIFWIYENAEPMSTTLILPPFVPAAVLEINAGDVKKYNIKVGDVVRHKWFPSTTEPMSLQPIEAGDGSVSQDENDIEVIEEVADEPVDEPQAPEVEQTQDNLPAETSK